MPSSRRELLAAGTALLTTTVAGCAGSAESSGADCETSVVRHGDPKVLQVVAAHPESDGTELRITFENGEAESADRLLVFDSTGDLRYEIPTDGRLTYYQHVGERPTHGRLRVVSLRDGERTDEVVVDFNCWSEDYASESKTAAED